MYEPSTSDIYTLSLHDALPISGSRSRSEAQIRQADAQGRRECQRRGSRETLRAGPKKIAGSDGKVRGQQSRQGSPGSAGDRKSTRLNSSHVAISYAVFCLKKKT